MQLTTRSITIATERFKTQESISPRSCSLDVGEGGLWDSAKKVKAVAEGRMPGVTLHENGGSQAGDTLRVVTDEETETMPRKQLSRAAGEMCAVLKIDDQGYTHRHSKRVRPSRSIKVPC